MRKQRAVWLLLGLLVLVAGGVTRWSGLGGVRADGAPRAESIRTVLEVISLVKTQYVDPVDTNKLIAAYLHKGTINGMLQEALNDRYTRYLDPASFRQMQIDTSGVFSGIGVVIGVKDEALTVIAPFEGTPGYRAGLRSGDRVISIDGRSTAGMPLDEAVQLLRGEEGTPVVLGIERVEGGTTRRFEVRIVRDVVEVPSVTSVDVIGPRAVPDLTHRVGYIRLVQFSERTDAELEQALRRLDRQQVAGLILDLRNNPGGLLSAAIDVANKFIGDGPIVHVVGRDRDRKTFNATPRGTRPPMPMVVLVNGYSASAAEIVAGALQDRGVATLVGTRTFGKGLVQTVIPLRDGSGLALTSARYQTAGGRFIHEKGIEPDVVVELPAGQGQDDAEARTGSRADTSDPQVRRALAVLEQKIVAWQQEKAAAKRAG